MSFKLHDKTIEEVSSNLKSNNNCFKIGKNKLINSRNHLKYTNLVHQNIQGIKCKILELELFMNSNNIDIMCITEHFLKSHEVMFNFSNHQVGSSFCRVSAECGGSLILLNKQIQFKERLDIVHLSVERHIEIACVELEQFIIISVYSPPSASFDIFEKNMEEVLHKLSKSNKNIITCGDFNVNILENNSLTCKIINLFESFGLMPQFMEPTRITATTAKCIDNIYSNVNIINKNLISKLTSDHLGQLIKIENQTKNIVKRKITFVPMTIDRLEKLKLNLLSILPFVYDNNNPNQLYETFFNKFSNAFNSIFTSKSIMVSNTTKFCDWATAGIHKSRRKLYELYGEKQYNFNEEFKEKVRNYSKIFKNVCREARSRFLSSKIKNSQNKIKTTWNIINNETGRVQTRNNEFNLNINNTTITLDEEVAKTFEHFFSDIPVSTTKFLNSSPLIAESFLKQNVTECIIQFKFDYINSDDIIKAFKLINVKKSTDLWGISITIIKPLIDIIAPELALIFNECIDCGVFPDLMKHSKIIPLFKSGSCSDPGNFRPISMLPTFSKIFEKIILNQLLRHFNMHNLLHNKQFGFTRGRSTTDAGVELITHIFDAWEESHDALGVFCDLSKAFDCVHHDTLIRKLHYYGIKGIALDFLTSYLSDRIQRVDVNGKRSPGSPVTMGVPQGSILGPFLFLVYINDLPYFVKDDHEVVLFADDTSLFFKLKRQQSDFDDVNNAISKVVKWFNVNNLLLNEKKTKCIRFILPNVKQVKANVIIKNEELALVDTTVFLGITLDNKLQWGPHIDTLSKKLSSAAYAVKKIRLYTEVDTARLVYFSYFHSLMSYGILLWGSAADIDTIFVLQKRAVRAIYNMGPKESLREKFKEISIMTVTCQYIYENLMYVHKNINLFKKNSDSHKYNTRNKDKLAVATSRLHKVSKSFKGQCIRFYNKLPSDMLKLSINKFKNAIKRKLYKKAYYKITDYLDDKKAWE